MNLSRKIILVVVSTFIALVFIVAAISDVILLNSYRQLEKKTVIDHIQLVYNQIEDRAATIEVTAGDLSQELAERSRDNTLLSSLEQRYFSESNLKIHRLDLAALYSSSGRLLAVRMIDCETGRYCAVGQSKLRALEALVSGILDSDGTTFNGTIDVDGVPFMVSAKHLMEAGGTRQGILVVGCFLDKVELDHISRVTGSVAQVVGLTTSALSHESALAHNELKRSGGMLSRVHGDASVSGYAYLRDIFGKPTYLLSITEKRSLLDQGKSAIYYTLLVLFVCGAVFCTVMLLFIRGSVLNRLADLSSTVVDISRNRDISARLDVRGEDELETLAGSINAMLASLESADSALRESELRYRALFERAPDSIFIIGIEGDEAGRIVDTNLAACSQHGFSFQELCTMRIQDLNTPETNVFAADMIERIKSGEWVSHEVWHFRKDGSRFPLEIHAGLIKLRGRDYILGVDRDITSRKMAEESDRMYLEQIRRLNAELARHAADLELANRELETFNYSVSHDLRGPLTRISGYCQLLLEDDSGVDPQTRTYLTRIYESSYWLDEMIDAMLRLSQLSRADFVPESVDLTALCQEQLNSLRLADPGSVVEVAVAPGVTVHGDTSLLKVLISNLINNAWKYSSRTGQARIEFGVMTDGPSPVYFVRDNGTGFDMKDADKLFRVFTRLHDPTQFSGTGIGLATVQRIITRHGGRVWAEGEVGRGATFFFTLAPDVQPV